MWPFPSKATAQLTSSGELSESLRKVTTTLTAVFSLLQSHYDYQCNAVAGLEAPVQPIRYFIVVLIASAL